MVRTDDAPVYMKAAGAYIIITVLITILFLYLDMDHSKYIYSDSILTPLGALVINTIMEFVAIFIVYGMLMQYRWCWVLELLLRLNTAYELLTGNASSDMTIGIMNVLAILLLFYPPIIRYCGPRVPEMFRRKRFSGE